MKIVQTEDIEASAVDCLINLIKNNSTKQILLLLSGGSWLSLYEKINPEIFSANVTISVLDERFSFDEKTNNFLQLKQTNFFQNAFKNGVKFIDTGVEENETLINHSNRFETALREWKSQNQNGIIIVTMGMGTDGHTAGIFPTFNFEDFDDKWVIGYEVDKSINVYTERVTVTPYFLINEVTLAVCCVSGENKCQMLNSILSNGDENVNLPARIWHKMQNVEVVTDCKL